MKRTGCSLGFAALLLAACTQSPQQDSPTLTIAVNAGVEGLALKEAAGDWGKKTGTTIKIVELPYSNLFEKELLDLKSKTGAYDVIMLDDPWFPQFARKNQLAPLDYPPDNDFIKSTLDVCREPWGQGTYYALPYVGNSQLFFYRKDLFKKYSLPPPSTWTSVLDGARKIGKQEKIYGYVMRAAAGNAVVTDFMPLLWAFGADVFSQDRKPMINSPEAVAALSFMLELGEVTPPGYTGYNADEVSAHLLQATAAMSINWPAWIGPMDDDKKSKIVGKIEFTQVPSEKNKGQAELGAWLVAIPSGSLHQKKAFDFIHWATEREQMKVAALRGNPPTRSSVFDDSSLLKKFRAFPVQKASLMMAKPRPRTPDWNEIENALGIYLSKANSKSMTPKAALDEANSEISAIVTRKN